MTDSEALTEARVREIMVGCEGVTPGPWTACLHIGVPDAHIRAEVHGCNICDVIEGTMSLRGEVTHADMQANAKHIGRLDPDTVRALCTLALSALGTAPAEPAGWKGRRGDYPLGTIAHSVNGGHWTRVEGGWKWHCGDTFPMLSADAFTVEIPAAPATAAEIRAGVVERALTQLLASVDAVLSELKPGQSLSPAGAGRTNALVADRNAARRALSEATANGE